jgi:hypothetical protein
MKMRELKRKAGAWSDGQWTKCARNIKERGCRDHEIEAKKMNSPVTRIIT